jgi:EAL domain-containing protein (putative c-di-GMP-specific phosphodiesterase class I)
VGDLRLALAEHRIHTLYQPIVRLSDRHPVGLEVLARLDHPRFGMLVPGRFIQSMETAGLVGELTEAVMVAAFADWCPRELAELGLTLAFNLPPELLLNDAALSALDRLRAGAGVPAACVVIELTESDPLADLAALARATQRLRGLGYGIAIDDVSPGMGNEPGLFGVGFTALKLDKAVVQDAADDAAAADFVRGACRDAHAAGMSVTAEGVEDEGLWSTMQALGVDLAQGYLISPPLAAAATRTWHRGW